MKKPTINQALTLTLIAVLAFSIGYLTNPLIQHFDPKVNVELYISENAGPSVLMYSGNLITDIGEYFIGNCTIGLDSNATWAISLSNVGSPLAAWTELDTEVAANGFNRTAAQEVRWTNGGDWAINFTYTFTASGSQQLQTAGLQWDATEESDNNLLAAATFTQTTFESADTLTVTWVITVNAN